MKAYEHEHNTYVNCQKVLIKEKVLDAVIIAALDFWYAWHAFACL